MTEQWTGAARTVLRDLDLIDRVRLASWLAILAHAAITAWALAGSWFYSDDFIFLADAHGTPLSLDFLFTPHDSQLMPIGVLVSWIVAQVGPFSWTAAVVSSVVLATVAAWACARMLRVLFGERPLVLVPLVFYAISPMAIEGWVWWAAALNTLPLHIAFFLAITAVVQWWRSRRPVHLATTLAAVALAALSGPRGLVAVVPLGLLVLLLLVPPATWRTPGRLLRDLWSLVVPGAAVAVAYLLVYRATTPSPVAVDGSAPAAGITRNLLVESWLPALIGGPLRWNENNPPMNQPTAPVVVTVVSALVVAAFLGWSWRRHRRVTVAAVLILLAQLTATTLALIFGRGLQLGTDAGLMTRYLTDTLPVTVLVLGLLLIPLATTDGEAVGVPAVRWPRWATVVTAAAFTAMCLTTTVTYMNSWHADYPARAFVENARDGLAEDPGPVADITVPALVQSPLSYPNNLPSYLLAPLGDAVDAVTMGTNLRVLDDEGIPRTATVFASTSAEPGPEPGCGYAVSDRWTRVTLDPDRTNFFWWVSVGYLASSDGEVEVRVDDRDPFTMPILQGLNTGFFSGEDPVETVMMRSLTPGLTVCVDTLALGDLVPLP
ncbi:hypothetical protein [Aeromicrobium sp. Leaf350]|uniref:hypothetical protein n=1 Tax=Aeromicrobium sp. Leaf350 TaxID=2876565 RepID=UPI001E5B457D|nr:hypothetical protein [Aeromicrobium sp. Leaf350]